MTLAPWGADRWLDLATFVASSSALRWPVVAEDHRGSRPRTLTWISGCSKQLVVLPGRRRECREPRRMTAQR
jgi:hypothetical protein